MRVSVEVPDPPRLEPLLESLSRQYQEVMQRLLTLQEEGQREDRYAPILQAMQAQQDGLVSAFQHMLGMMKEGKDEDHETMRKMMQEEVSAPHQEANEALLSAIRGMKRSLSALPDDFAGAMNKQMKSRQHDMMKSPTEKKAPDRTGDIVSALGRLEQAVVTGSKRSRNRTFGSNY